MSEIHTGEIDQLQQDICDRLTSYAKLANIDIIYEKNKDIESDIQKALGPTKGVCIVVTPPICKSTKPNLRGPYFDDVGAEINVPENVIINQSSSGLKKTASYVCELAARRLHLFVTRSNRCLIVTSIVPVPDPQYRVYRASVRTAIGLPPET